MEHFRLSSKTENLENREKMLEDSFLSVVYERVIESMSEALEEAGFSPEDERMFRKSLSTLPVVEIGGVLSMPYELRQRRLPKLFEKMKEGMSIADIVQQLASEARERGFRLGYHMSNFDIAPLPKKEGGESWTVDGKEQDHRDADLPMAYYSTDLANLYAKKRARFLYIVRAETAAGTTHKQDNDGSWGRAPKLDVVDKLNYEDVMREVRARVGALEGPGRETK